MSALTPEVEAAFNTGAKLVHLITLHADGRPQVTVVRTASKTVASAPGPEATRFARRQLG